MKSKTVSITIVGEQFEINCPEGQEKLLKSAAERIHAEAMSIRKASPKLGMEKLLVLCCINLCTELMQLEGNSEENRQSKILLEKMIVEARHLAR